MFNTIFSTARTAASSSSFRKDCSTTGIVDFPTALSASVCMAKLADMSTADSANCAEAGPADCVVDAPTNVFMAN